MVNENLESAMETDNKLSEEARTKLPELQVKLQEHFKNIERNGEYIKFKQGYDSELLRFEPERTKPENVLYNGNQVPGLQYKRYASQIIERKAQNWRKVREWTASPRSANPVISLSLKGFLTKMNGFELYEQLKNIDDKVKVCFITAYEIYYRALRDLFPTIQVDCFIAKPIGKSELLSRIKADKLPID
jgi:hypothetical protein